MKDVVKRVLRVVDGKTQWVLLLKIGEVKPDKISPLFLNPLILKL
jgi:hypothetical protein